MVRDVQIRGLVPLTGRRLRSIGDARTAARELLGHGPQLVALAVEGEGDLVVWPDGEQLHRHHDEALDATGAGDAFVAGMVAALSRGAGPGAAGSASAAAAAATVTRLGGRPALSPALLGAAGIPRRAG
jgi:ribokinase